MPTHQLAEDVLLRQYELAVLDFKKALKSHGEALAEHKQLINSLQPVGKIPVEILLLIFVSCIKDAPLKRYGSRVPWERVRLTHVCSRWRAVAISSLTLWDIIDLTWPAWTKELVTRSQQAPLTVTYTPGLKKVRYSPKMSVTKYVFRHCVPRITRLHICTSRNRFRMLYNMLPLRLPALRFVTLSFAHNDRQLLSDWPYITQLVDPLCLRLSGSWTTSEPRSLFHPTLKILSLRHNMTLMYLPLQDVTNALQSMPYLKYLSLHNICDRGTVFQAKDVSRPVLLPQLTHLTIEDTAKTCVVLLNKMKLASLTSLKVTTTTYDTLSLFTHLCSAIADAIEFSPSFLSISRLSLKYCKGMKHLIAGGPESVGIKPARFAPPRPLTFLNIYIHTLSSCMDLNLLISRLNLERLQQLDLDFLHLCPSLERIYRLSSITTLRV